MEIEFLTPFAALFALTALAPLAVFLVRRRHARRIRASLRLDEPARRSWLPFAVTLAACPILLGLAAAQPVVAQTRSLPERTDAQVFVVIDISRSMLAAAGPDAPTRFERAQEIAVDLRDRLPEVPIGIASMTTGMLPHLFPTTDRRVYVETLEDTLSVGRVWTGLGGTIATSLDALVAAPRLNYFPPSAEKRVLVVLTDGESLPLQQDLAAAFRRQPPIQTIFIHVWDEGERVYLGGVPEAGYVLDETSRATLERVASLIRGRVVAEDDVGDAASLVRDLLGTGTTEDREQEGERLALMPYLSLAAILPLGFVLLRRNL